MLQNCEVQGQATVHTEVNYTLHDGTYVHIPV